MNKLLASFLSIFFALMTVACGDDNLNEPYNGNNNLSIEAAKFVGTWYNNRSYGGIYYTFQSDGTCFSSPSNGNPDYLMGTGHRGTWKYLENERMLITTLEVGGDCWKIYNIFDNSWTGQLQSSTFPTFSYIKYQEPSIPAKDQDWCPSSFSGRKILMDINYLSSGNDEMNEIYRCLFYESDVRCFHYGLSKDTRPGYGYRYSKVSSTEGNLKLSNIGYIPEIYYDLDFIFDSNATFAIRGTKQIGKNNPKIYQVSGSGKYIDNVLVD